ncbi:MAG TPA: HEAT repeat domain-containing protein [Candidatus Norongarragalinales archaeon]|jgi:HEAT repeat protein|nr:HEAT repeat domain-containing protein [Candidatus Norongarragalinales archaeon]
MSKLEQFFKRGNPQNVTDHLAKMRNPANIATALQHENWRVRLAAAEALGRIGKEAAPFAAQALKHEDSDVREAAADALGLIGPAAAPFAKDIVEQALKHEDRKVRYAATEALGRIGKEAAPFAAQALKHENRKVRYAAARAAKRIGNAEVLPELEKARDRETDLSVKRHIEYAIRASQPGIFRRLIGRLKRRKT